MAMGWLIVYVWVISILVYLFSIDFSLIVVLIMIVGNSLSGFMFLELFFIGVLLLMMYNSSTFERSGSYIYLAFFSLVIGFVVVGYIDMSVSSWVVLLVVLAKLPIFGLHMWLPKVHVEASMLGSIFLAGLILKGSTFLYFLIGDVFMMSGILMLLCSVVMMRYIDGKGVVAMSSVLHMGSSVIFMGMVYMVGFTHVVVSPLMFYGVYVIYNNSGVRMMWSMGSLVLLVNLGFPCLGAFFCEMFVSYMIVVVVFVISYYLSIIFTVNLYMNDVKNINGWLVAGLLCLIMLW